MRKLKKALSLSLALILSLALAVPAFAAPVTVGEKFVNFAHVTFSDVVSQEDIKGRGWALWADGTSTLITAKVGTTLIVESEAFPSDDGRTFDEAFVNSDGSYDFKKDGKPFNTGVPDGTPFTLTDAQIGLWFFTGGDSGTDFYLKVIAGDGSATTPTGPTVPTQPEQPTEPTQPEQPSTPTTPTIPSTPAASGSYTVKKGDTWSRICTNYYGTNAQRYALMKANKGVTLKEGAVITLPEKLGKDTLIPASVVAAGEKLYTVKAGDTLGKIAAAEYGKVSEYKAIFQRNADRLKNANTIYEGQVIVLPIMK